MSTISKLLSEWNILYDVKFDKVMEDSWDHDGDGYNNTIDWQTGPGGQFHNGVDSPTRHDGYDHEDKLNQRIVEDALRDRWSEFERDFENKTDEAPNGDLLVYRCIATNDADEFIFHIAHGEPLGDFKGLGVYWSWDKSHAECHWGQGTQRVTVHGAVPYESIEVYNTLIANLSPSLGENEAEITLLEGKRVTVMGIDLDGEYYSPTDEGLDPIPMTAIRAFEENPMPVGPEPDGNFDREDQLVEVGMPEMNRVQLKEALLIRPYNLGKETRFMPDPVKYPGMHKMLCPEHYKEPVAPPAPEPKAEPKEEREYPAVDKFLKEEEE